MLEGVDFTVSYKPVAGICSLCIITVITSAEGLIIFVLDIQNDFQNTILPNYSERVYISLPYLYLEFYKRKWPKYPLASRNQKETQGKKPAGKLWYDLLKSILITVKMTIISSDNSVFSWVYKNYK